MTCVRISLLPILRRRKRDFLGYYKALGINLEDAGEGLACF